MDVQIEHQYDDLGDVPEVNQDGAIMKIDHGDGSITP